MTLHQKNAAVRWGLTIVMATVLEGCHHPDSHVTSIPCRSSHTVFNPEWSGLPAENFARSDWPSADSSISPREELAYQERYIDIQGWDWGWTGDYQYRRFESVRSGQSRK